MCSQAQRYSRPPDLKLNLAPALVAYVIYCLVLRQPGPHLHFAVSSAVQSF